MERFDFFAGLFFGVLVGGVGVFAGVKIRGWFASSEVRELQRHNQELQRRLRQKDRYIDEMLQRAEHMAEEIRKERKAKDET